jgi:MFS family permease
MGNNPPSEAPAKKGLGSAVQKSIDELKETFTAFFKAPRALWGINVAYVIEGLVYFGILTILGKYCSENVGLSDLYAGWVYGGVTGGITFAMLLFGGLSDKIGVRRSLIIALLMMMFGRALVAFSGTIPLGKGVSSPMFYLMTTGLLIMVAAYGLYQPAVYAGVKRYTNEKTAAIAYAVIYGLMNLGAFFSGFISPVTRHHFETVFPPNGLSAVFWVYTLLTLISVLTTVFILTKKTDQAAVNRIALENNNQDKKEIKSDIKVDNRSLFISLGALALVLLLTILAKLGKISLPVISGYITLALLSVLSFWLFLKERPEHPFRDVRFVYFIFILIPVQTLFAHNWLTLPYYLDRAFAGTFVGEYFELFANINPILVFLFAPVIAALTAKTDIYKMMIYGTLVMALPTFLLAVGPNVYLFLLYVFLMTIGESMWQPRFLQWISEIAPEGKTGAYMGIGQLPWFLTKMITAFYSGYFVANYIPRPETGFTLRTGEMWFFYGLIAIISPIGLILSKKWMEKGMRQKAA